MPSRVLGIEGWSGLVLVRECAHTHVYTHIHGAHVHIQYAKILSTDGAAQGSGHHTAHGSILSLVCGLGPFPARVLPFLPLTSPSPLTEPQLFKVSVQPETHMLSSPPGVGVAVMCEWWPWPEYVL